MRRAVVSWIAVGILFVTACVLSVIALNADLYSAGGFVRSYLDALDRRDAAAALAMPGVVADNSEALLTDAALGGLGDIRIISDTRSANGTHIVVAGVTLDSGPIRTTFELEPLAAHLGLFSTWRFSTSPLATLAVSASGDDTVSVNDEQLALTGDDDHLVFVPGVYRLDRESAWLEATDLSVAVTTVGTVTDATLEIRANAAFRAAASRQITATLDECAEQQVLQPGGCPFGRVVDDRVAGTVRWSIAEYPVVTLSPGENPGKWTATAAQGRAALEVPVQSLFTGKRSRLDATVSISASYDILLSDDNTFTIGPAG